MLERTFPVLETQRLFLREILQSDVDAIYRLYSAPKVAEYDVFMPIGTLDAARNIISNYSKEYTAGSGVRWGVTAKDSNCVIGTCGFLNIDWSSRRCEIGFGLIPGEWGKGIMKEALEIVILYGFNKLRLNRMEAFIDVENEASVRLMKKVNFQLEGVLRQREYFKGSYHDEIIMSLIATEDNR